MLVLSGRIALPRLPNTLVERERLLLALDGALSTPLTLLCAPAGFGKTTLLSTWAGRHTAQVAWLSLDAGDNDWPGSGATWWPLPTGPAPGRGASQPQRPAAAAGAATGVGAA